MASCQSTIFYTRPITTITAGTPTTNTADQVTYGVNSITPVKDDLIVILATGTDSTANATLGTSGGLTFTRVAQFSYNGGVDTVYVFIADQLSTTSTVGPNMSFTGDAATGMTFTPLRVKNMAKTGSTALKQSATNSNSSGTPSVTFSSAIDTNNPTIGICGSGNNPGGLTVPTGWSSNSNVGYSSPTAGANVVSRASGFSSTTITWGSSSATPYGALFVELDWS